MRANSGRILHEVPFAGSTAARNSNNDAGALVPSGSLTWLLVLTAVLLTRFSWVPSYLSTDTVNLAYALESFDPSQHQPQPPGYPFFVVLSRVVHMVSPGAEVTFWIVSLLLTILAAAVTFAVARLMFNSWAAVSAALLFAVTPVLWFARLRSPLRPSLALFSALVAYCAWKAWNGDRRFAFWGAVALGIGSGFRPDLLAYLLPLWAVSTWLATKSWRQTALAGSLAAAICAIWLVAIMLAVGGPAPAIEIAKSYVIEQSSKDSLIFSAAADWSRPISRLLIWNGISLIGWVWIPVVSYRSVQRIARAKFAFLALWLLPGLAAQLLFHIAAPGHTLFATPAWCALGGYVLSTTGRWREALLTFALAINAGLFLNVLPLGYPPGPDATPLERTWIQLRNTISFGTFETSMDRLRWWDEMAEVSIEELRRYSAKDRPNMIVALNGTETEFDFLNWRVVSYYVDRPLTVLMDNLPPGAAGRIRSVKGSHVQVTSGEGIAVPASARILWVLLPDGRFHKKISGILPVHRGRYIVYSDLAPGQEPFEIEGFKFLPVPQQSNHGS